MTRRTPPTGHVFLWTGCGRGLRKVNAALTCWLKEIAPSPGLREWFGHDPERYGEFARRYRAELEGNDGVVGALAGLAIGLQAELLLLQQLADNRVADLVPEFFEFGGQPLEFLVKQGPVTLLYAAHVEGHNHALVLAEYLCNHMERGHGKRPV